MVAMTRSFKNVNVLRTILFMVLLLFCIVVLYKFSSKVFLLPSSSTLQKSNSQIKNIVDTIPAQPIIQCENERFSKKISSEPTIYGITPTYARLTQKADLTRLLQTLLNVPNFHWIVVEDSDKKTSLVTKLLKESGLFYTQLNVRTRFVYGKGGKKGIDQRNLALTWIRGCIPRNQSGVVYFMDDDNTYSLKVFEEIRTTKVASCWLVGFAGGLKFEGPGKCKNGTVLSWYVAWNPKRKFPIDMAAFAVNLNLILNNIHSLFSYKWRVGTLETSFLESLGLTMKDMEAKANCTEVLAWHTKTGQPTIVQQRAPWYNPFKKVLAPKLDVEV